MLSNLLTFDDVEEEKTLKEKWMMSSGKTNVSNYKRQQLYKIHLKLRLSSIIE